jgi:hypothetical protein
MKAQNVMDIYRFSKRLILIFSIFFLFSQITMGKKKHDDALKFLLICGGMSGITLIIAYCNRFNSDPYATKSFAPQVQIITPVDTPQALFAHIASGFLSKNSKPQTQDDDDS